MKYISIKTLFFSLLSFLIMQSCARNPVTGKRELMLMTERQEIALGKESDPGIVQSFGLYQNQAIQDFINKKGKKMAAISHRPQLNYEFKVLDSPVINAFAVPGGYVYFTRGILAHFNNEAELAGVLGHEIGHITARHSAKQYSKQMLGQVALMGGIIFSEKFRTLANEANVGMSLLFLKFGRDNESESDKLGVEYSTKIGYDSHNMANFFNTLKSMQQENGQSIPNFLSTHPDPGNRYNKVHEMSDAIQADLDKSALETNRNSYLRLIDGIVYGDDPRQGFVEDNMFYHPELRFQFPIPNDWQTNNMPSTVQMAPESGDAVITMSLSNEASLHAASQKVITDNKLNVIESSDTRVNGLTAKAIIAEQVSTGQNGQSQTIRMLSYYISYNQSIYVLHGMSDANNFNIYFPKFQKTMKGFKKLTNSIKLNKKPTLIRIKTVVETSSLQQALSNYGMNQEQMEKLSMLNAIKLNGIVKKGSLVKVFEN